MRRATAQVVLIAAACASTDGRAGIDVLERDSAAVVLVDIRGDANALPVLDLTGPAAFEIRGEAAPHLGSVGEVELLSDGRVLVEDNQTRELHPSLRTASCNRWWAGRVRARASSRM